MQLKKILHISLFTFALFLITSCDTTNPQNNEKVTLTAEDASCTEVWLNVKTKNISLPTTVRITQDDSTIITTNINKSDTTLIVEKLQPNRAYTFKATIEKDKVTDQTQITTMDTTSHNFTWETFTFGGVNGSSYLKDVAIINENNIWAVGEIHTAETDQWNADSTKWVQPYNAVHWDGNSWELKRILVDYRGQPNFAPLQGVFALPDGKVIFSSGLPYLPSGNHWNLYHLWDMGVLDNEDGGVNSIWGTSIDNLYFVGSKGTIVHYNGSSWTKIESGTDVDLLDIWGSPNGEKIWVCGNEDFKPTVLLTIKNNKVDILYSSEKNLFSYGFYRLSGSFMSLWSDNKNILHILTEYDLYKIYKDDVNTPIPLWKKRNEQIATRKVRGTKENDIFIVGEIGELCHYNGVSWKTYSELSKKFKEYKSISVNKNIAVAVGQDYINGIEDKAIISITKK